MPQTKPIKDPKEAIARGFAQPFSLFRRWQKDAVRSGRFASADIFLLATVCAKTLRPSQRPMQLADVCDNAFLFLSTLTSRKGDQISQNKNVSLYFDWLKLDRYVMVEGEATLVRDRHVVNSYFQKIFPSELKCYFSAIDNNQSKVIDSEFKEKFQDLRQKICHYKDSMIPPPDSMVLFKIEPSYFEFYENSNEVGNVRLAYSRLVEGAKTSTHTSAPSNTASMSSRTRRQSSLSKPQPRRGTARRLTPWSKQI
uniref:pyridoxal 5'-phosphate synthase n=1 Tax=Macrostomum lignano TaxID=282301 RepID=A0A1I8H8B0_9PLAT